MNISKEHIDYRKQIGKIKKSGAAAHEVRTTGGLYLVVVQDGNKLKTLGSGPHRGVARYIAEKNEPDLLITDLSKSDSLDPATMLRLLPIFYEITERIRALE